MKPSTITTQWKENFAQSLLESDIPILMLPQYSELIKVLRAKSTTTKTSLHFRGLKSFDVIEIGRLKKCGG